ncbi:AlwI family type II restriction endonuclease [Mesoplasma lactucae]|nr:AlwI family type II restriction endonuclease [Mesoplasma lactucae]
MAKPKSKPLSFTTTLRNPQRIAQFLEILKKYEGQILTNELIQEICRDVVKNKIYQPLYIKSIPELNKVLNSEENFTDEQAKEIIKNSPQNHKEAGFTSGWPSRFDTWYKITKEFAFTNYAIGKPIQISPLGDLLIKSDLEQDSILSSAVFTISMMRYKTNNLYRKNANDNHPLILLLNTIVFLRTKLENKFKGLSKKELALFLCWPNDDYEKLGNLIIDCRIKFKNHQTKENYYEICLSLLGTNVKESGKYIKQSKIFDESVDDYIRKMRETGLISLRGNGLYIDENTSNKIIVDYIVKMPLINKDFSTSEEYFEENGKVDKKIISLFLNNVGDSVIENISAKNVFLEDISNRYSYEEISKELNNLIKSKTGTKDELLKNISEPTRLEFLTAALFKKKFPNETIIPNYIADDQGVPYTHAPGGKPDILFKSSDLTFPIEVTLLRSKDDLFSKEIIPIKRHLLDNKEENEMGVVIFVSPRFHEDNYDEMDFLEERFKISYKPIVISELVDKITNLNDYHEVINL